MPTSEDIPKKYLGLITSTITIVTMLIGLGINWGMTKAELTTVNTRIEEVKNDRDKKEVMYKSEIDNLKEEIVVLKMKGAADEQWRKNTTETLQKIEQALERLANTRNK